MPASFLQDFKEQIIHHVATIILLSFSWFANYVRAGTLIMALHDSSDYLLEVRLPHSRDPSASSFVPLVSQGVEDAIDIPGTEVGGHSQCC